jgi:transcription termination factor Rho
MPSVLDRDELTASPLADLHTIANELGVDGYRRLRKAVLIDAIIARQAGEDAPVEDAREEDAPVDAVETAAVEEPVTVVDEHTSVDEAVAEEPVAASDDAGDEDESRRSRRGRRGGRGRSRSRDEDADTADAEAGEPAVAESRDDDRVVEGVLELLANGSGFVRLAHPEVSEDDVYLSAAQIKRCELVSGDRVAGPVRAPRRSERHPSLVRVETINGRPADEVAEGTRFEDLTAVFPAVPIELGGELELVDRMAPIGKGSRVAVAGEPHTGKSEMLRRVAETLHAREDFEVIVALAGIRPEEAGDWTTDALPAPSGVATLGASPDAQAQVIEGAVELGRRVAARGGDAVVVIDTLEQVPVAVARKALGAARNLADAGSLTILAALREPVGGETTLVRLDPLLAATGRYPAVAPVGSFTMRSELLVGEKAAKKARDARAKSQA